MAEQSQSAPEQTKKVLEDLIERFSRNLDAYKSPTYKEDQCRIEFINPFFESLGWDMANKQGFAEQYKEVVHEDTLNMSGLTKAPDYSFRIGGTRKFFLEAKKPAVSIKTDASPAHQLRRYAWSAKLPLSILTDFEEFAVYDCRIKPNEKDKPDAARVRYLTYEQYFDELNWIYATFSKEAILKGSFDRFAESSKGKKGTSEVDAEFLKEIESWRVALAKNIALRNPALNVHQLNDAVQRTIDRIIFLRMAEDRGIENYQQLFGAINGANIYKRLIELFYQSEDKYNSGLFDFKKDSFTTSLKIDDQALADIISDLYYPKCPYEFSVLGADTLGNIYEQFLGKVIRLTAGHQAKIEEKPEVKKAGGVYYTPKYIVDYIVQNTVGKLISGRGTEFSGRDTLVPGQKGISSSLLIRQHDLPHWQAAGSIYFVTFRSARGALPEPALKQVMENISFEEGKKFDLFLAVVMPNHVHMLLQPREIEPGVWHDLGEIMKGIKGVSSRRINQIMGTTGQVWQKESFDHIVRDEKEFDQKMEYMIFNPVKAGLVKEPEEYNYFVRGGGFENPPLDSRADTLVGQQKEIIMRDKSVPPTESLSPKEISKIKILDPACGSGSFLLGAYQYLLDYHLKFYESQMRDKSVPPTNKKSNTLVSGPDTPVGGFVVSPTARKNLPIYQGPRGQWLLTTSKKKEILLNNIFGVDIDPQAVEVTKLSLLLKVLENESEESLKKQLQLFHERALPDLDNNIKCGNSLIGNDFYANQQRSLFDDEQKLKINAFDWETEFKDIFKNGGFDAVIGNPPYGASFTDSELQYLRKIYSTSVSSADSFALFIEKSSNLLSPEGIFGMIVQSSWVSAPSFLALRNLFISRFRPVAFATMPYDVFGAYVDTVITIAEKLPKNKKLTDFHEAPASLVVFPPRYKIQSVEDFRSKTETANAINWIDGKDNVFLITLSDKENNIVKKILAASDKFSNFTDIQRGVTPFGMCQAFWDTPGLKLVYTGTDFSGI